MKKPIWVINKERKQRTENLSTIWLFGLHAVRDALENPRREKQRLIVTRNAADKLEAAIAQSGLTPEIADPRRFPAPLDPTSVHQGAALEALPLDWGGLTHIPREDTDRVVVLDRVTDPHNIGAILRSAEVFGAHAVLAPHRHSAPETGALAKAASGALERQPYIRVPNLGNAMQTLKDMGYLCIGFDGQADHALSEFEHHVTNRPLALVFGAEGPGLRPRTLQLCDHLLRIDAAGDFGSLNVSNAVAVALYATRAKE